MVHLHYTDDDEIRNLAKRIAWNCVRNSSLDALRAGVYPRSASADYSDVKVITPFGEIPWTEVSRISSEEMQALMHEVVDKIYTVLVMGENIPLRDPPHSWEEPKLDHSFLTAANLVPEKDPS
jgi:hypothetical protein